MEPMDLIGLAGLLLAVPSSAVALNDLSANRTSRTEESSPSAAAVCSRPRRILSMIVDTYVTTIAAVGIAAALTPPELGREEADAAAGVVFVALVVALGVWNATTGRSPGKLLVGAQLIRQSDRTLPLTFLRALARICCHAIPFGFWLVLGPSRRTAADRLTDTLVIQVR